MNLRPETPADRAFRYQLFCDSRLPEWYAAEFPPGVREQLLAHQFEAQTASYPMQFPQARFEIVELDGEPIGRIVVDRPGDHIHIVDQAITPQMRGRGLGTAIMRALMDEAAAGQIPVRLKVASANDPSMQLYLRLGFRTIEVHPMYLDMEWRAG